MGWFPIKIIEETLKNTTQYGRSLNLYGEMRKHFKSRFPSLNVTRRNEKVATDTVFADTKAHGSGVKCAQIFVGRDTMVSDIYPLKSDEGYLSTLQENVQNRGAMDMIISDSAKQLVNNKVKQYLRSLVIKDWESEPGYQNQNFAERRYGTIKRKTNEVMNRTGCPPDMWFYCMEYVCYVLNHIAHKSLNYKTPLQMLTGQTTDISTLLHFTFWEEVYFSKLDTSFPSTSTEGAGHFIGIGENVGDALTFKILSRESNQVIYRSNVRSGELPQDKNKRAELVAKTYQDRVHLRSR
jgi:hypothetical protein